MAEKLLRYYNYITEQQGMEGKILLAKETKIPSVKAAIAPDSPENIRIFLDAIKKITGKAVPPL